MATATSMAASASSTVAGSRSAIAAVTRLVRPQRHAQIAARGAREKRGVLNEQRPVEAEPAAQLGDAFGRRGIAEHRLDRIAGNEMDEREDERRDAQQDRNREQQAAGEKPQHGRP